MKQKEDNVHFAKGEKNKHIDVYEHVHSNESPEHTRKVQTHNLR